VAGRGATTSATSTLPIPGDQAAGDPGEEGSAEPRADAVHARVMHCPKARYLCTMSRTRIVDVVDGTGFNCLPPCADPAFDHRTCDYWEDADRGSKAHRAGWLAPSPGAGSGPGGRSSAGNPFAPGLDRPANPFAPNRPAGDPNPFVPAPARPPVNLFALEVDDDSLADNPFAPRRSRGTGQVEGPRKLGLLTRGLAIFGSYAKVLLVDDAGEASEASGERPVAFGQFGPLSAYPRALRLRELYPKLPQAPLPAVITCIATTAEARREGHALRLVEAICADLAGRGFSAVEAYPELRARRDATSGATVAFWQRADFAVAVPDERFPVVRREL
jgi:hypothetical protein